MGIVQSLARIVTGRVEQDALMAAYTTLGVGGPADYLVEPRSEDELCALMQHISDNHMPWMLLGDGANLLVADKGIRGVVILLGDGFTHIKVDDLTLTAGAAARISAAADAAAKHSLSGLEGAGTVPGTVGGAVVMNAGTHRGYIDEILVSVSIVTESGERRVLSRQECGFTYRGSRFQTDRSLIITRAEFALRPGNGAEIQSHLDEVRKHRAASQPQGRSAGCFFKNPEGQSAGKLIELAGGKGLRQGGALVSDIHANFILNDSDATAQDLRALAERVRQMVMDKHGVLLEYEVRLVGEW